MASIKIFRNETPRAPITVEPVVWVTPEERRAQLWELARQQILTGDCSQVGPQPTGGLCNAQSSDEVADRISAQDEASTHIRRKTRQRTVEGEQTGDETLRAGAEQKLIRLGVRERVVGQDQTVMTAMIVAKGTDQDRVRVTGKGKSRGGGTRGLLHPGSLTPHPVEQPGKLGASTRVLLRAQGEHNIGSRVIA